MEEINHQNLAKALKKLPQFQAPEGLWSAIELQLDAEEPLYQAIRQLPVYEAPSLVWDNISKELTQGAPVRQLKRWIPSAAAAATLLITASWVAIRYVNQPKISVAYSQEVQAQSIAQNDWDQDESDFIEVQSRYKQACRLHQTTDNRKLSQELVELNAAKKEIKEAIELYGNDPELMRELGIVEMDRSKVARQMAEVAL
jgi:hypothetical protein